MTYEPLFKKASKGAVQKWYVTVDNDTVTVHFGQVDGKFQQKQTICKPKNVGKANETSGYEQALKEAQSKWDKQLKKGYVTNSSGVSDVKLPMKVEAYFKGKNKNKIEFPAHISRKLNGVNGEARMFPNGSIVQLSRGGELYPLPHEEALKEIKEVMKLLDTTSINYEIYCHGQHLQDITGAVKAPKNHPDLHKKLEYHIFDLPSLTGICWRTRYERLSRISKKFKFVKIVECEVVNSHDDIIKFQDKVTSEKFEGSIVRNCKGLYEYNKRTSDVQKVKYVESAEFKIISYTIDKNRHPVFICGPESKLFSVKIKGTDEYRKSIVPKADSWKGKWLTVEFETYSKDGVPLKPVGIGLRNGKEDEKGNFVPSE